MKIIFLLLSLSISCFVNAQDKNIELVTDRPDQTESSSVVPKRALQIETGFMRAIDKTALTMQKSFAYNTTLLRYGLLDNFELRLGLEYIGENMEPNNSSVTSNTSGLSPIYTGFKVKISDEDGWKPELAFLGGLVLPFTASDDFKPTYTAATIRFAFSHTLSKRFSLASNLGAEWDGEAAVPGYFYSFVVGAGLSDKLAVFVENYGLIPEKGDAEHMLDAGFTYLILPNLQFDISGGIGINDYATDSFLGLGFTFRIPE